MIATLPDDVAAAMAAEPMRASKYRYSTAGGRRRHQSISPPRRQGESSETGAALDLL
jgi:hypothetical protein